MLENVNPCACGEKEDLGIYAEEDDDGLAYFVLCGKCMRQTDWHDTEADALEAWNAGEVRE